MRAPRKIPILSSRLNSYSAAVAIALLAYFLSFDLNFLRGTGVVFERIQGDEIFHIVGALRFLREGWHWPLGHIAALGYPDGTNIVFTDSLPLFALPLKLLSHWLTANFEYFGLWYAVCYLLQAVVACLLLREAGMRGPVPCLGAVLALSMPAWLARPPHAALCGHFLILLGLWAYVRAAKAAPRQLLVTLGSLAVCALLVHVYLFAMVMGLVVASLCRAATCRAVTWGLALGEFFGILALCGAVMFIVGHLTLRGGLLPAGGFGFFSMNALSPFYPAESSLFGTPTRLDATGGQYEGYNYLGIGPLALLSLSIVAAPGRLFSLIRRHVWLCVVLSGFTLFALSTRIYVGSWLALDLKLPTTLSSLAELFRASGRFFWPTSYAILIGVIVLTCRRLRPPVAVTILVLAALCQFWETQGLRQRNRTASTAAHPHVLEWSVWDPLLASHRQVALYPDFYCTDGTQQPAALEIQLRAALLGIPISSPLSARQARSCEQNDAVLFAQPLRDGELSIYLGNTARATALWRRFGESCARFAGGAVCSAHQDPSIFEADFAPMKRDIYRQGMPLDFSLSGNARDFLGSGWSRAGEKGYFTVGPTSDLLFDLGSRPQTDLLLALDAEPFIVPGRNGRTITVWANNAPVASWNFTESGRKVLTVRVPSSLVKSDGLIQIVFLADPVPSLQELGLSSDTRHIGLEIYRAVLSLPSKLPPFPPPPEGKETVNIDFSSRSHSDVLFESGWLPPEPWGRWTSRPSASLVVPPQKIPLRWMNLDILEWLISMKRPSQPISVDVNDCRAVINTRFNFPSAPRATLSGWIPDGCAVAGQPIRITITTDKTVRPIDIGDNPDPRQIGLGIVELRLW